MTKRKHPTNRFERIVNAKKKEERAKIQAARDKVRRQIKERLKEQETDHELRTLDRVDHLEGQRG